MVLISVSAPNPFDDAENGDAGNISEVRHLTLQTMNTLMNTNAGEFPNGDGSWN